MSIVTPKPSLRKIVFARFQIGAWCGLLGTVLSALIANLLIAMIQGYDSFSTVIVGFAIFLVFLGFPTIIIGVVAANVDIRDRHPLLWVMIEATGLGLGKWFSDGYRSGDLQSVMTSDILLFGFMGGLSAGLAVWLKQMVMISDGREPLKTRTIIMVAACTLLLIIGIFSMFLNWVSESPFLY